ncbi:MAG: amidohydrolase family protein [Methanoculleaceae archaeon]
MERTFTGQVIRGQELEVVPARVVVEDGCISSIEEEPSADPDRLIVPAFFNAHTHLGDTVAMDIPLDGDLASIVAPPDGLKHRILRTTPRDELVAAMRASLRTMIAGGTAGCADFREGGPGGVEALREACRDLPIRTVIFGRDGGERISEGLGISSTGDVPDLDDLIGAARKEGKLIAIHAGERDADDIDRALAYDPDLLVHCTHARSAHLRYCADHNIPVAICPRANWAFGVTSSPDHPPVKEMIRVGCEVLLGTDNVLAVQPDILQEMAFLSRVYRCDPAVVLRSAVHGASLFSSPHYIEEGSPAHFFTVDLGRSNLRYTKDPIAAVVHRLHAGMIEVNVMTVGRE